MEKATDKPKSSGSTSQVPRTTVINLKGTGEQAAWLEGVHKKTHIPKAQIVRLALDAWARQHGHEGFPAAEG